MSTPPTHPGDQLEVLLARWAQTHRLDDKQASAVHAAILQATAEPPVELDAEWLWGLLRPVTALLDGPNRFSETVAGLISVGA